MNSLKSYHKSGVAAAMMLLLAGTVLCSCEKDLPLYDTDTCRLNFYYNISSRSDYDVLMSKTNYSFVYGAADRQRDTLWFEVETMGFVYDYDRAIALEQLPSDGIQAVPGQHYVAFDDPSVASLYVVPAGKARTKIPVILLRDASLKSTTVMLNIGIKENDNFIQGYPEYATRQIVFTDMLSEPSRWIDLEVPYPAYPEYTYFGKYGVVKHQFLIDETGEKWDDEYITWLLEGDSNYLTYMIRKMALRLAEVNAERVAKGLDVLKEADGTVVEINDPYA